MILLKIFFIEEMGSTWGKKEEPKNLEPESDFKVVLSRSDGW